MACSECRRRLNNAPDAFDHEASYVVVGAARLEDSSAGFKGLSDTLDRKTRLCECQSAVAPPSVTLCVHCADALAELVDEDNEALRRLAEAFRSSEMATDDVDGTRAVGGVAAQVQAKQGRLNNLELEIAKLEQGALERQTESASLFSELQRLRELGQQLDGEEKAVWEDMMALEEETNKLWQDCVDRSAECWRASNTADGLKAVCGVEDVFAVHVDDEKVVVNGQAIGHWRSSGASWGQAATLLVTAKHVLLGTATRGMSHFDVVPLSCAPRVVERASAACAGVVHELSTGHACQPAHDAAVVALLRATDEVLHQVSQAPGLAASSTANPAAVLTNPHDARTPLDEDRWPTLRARFGNALAFLAAQATAAGSRTP